MFQEEAKALRKRNIKVFSEILDSMPSLTYCTTWSEAQQMLLDNPRFTEDPDLQSKSNWFSLPLYDNGKYLESLVLLPKNWFALSAGL